nr:hypothetical protein [Pseudomonas fluorescens]
MDVLMGLLAALLWGGTDFLVELNVRAVGVKRAVFFKERLTAVQVTGVVLGWGPWCCT